MQSIYAIMINLQKGAKTHQLQKTANLHQAKIKTKITSNNTSSAEKLEHRGSASIIMIIIFMNVSLSNMKF